MKGFINLGAYEGDTLEMALKKYIDFDCIYAFEPFINSFEVLQHKFGNIFNIFLYNCAVGTITGKTKLYLHQNIEDLLKIDFIYI